MEMEVPIENNSFSGESGSGNWRTDTADDNNYHQNQNQGHFVGPGGGSSSNTTRSSTITTSSISNNKNFLFNHQDGSRFVEQSGLQLNSSRLNRRERIVKESKDYRKSTTSSTIITPNISQIKIAIVGDSTTGKSTICHRLLSSSADREGQNFSPKYQMTIGVNVVTKSMKIPNAYGQEERLNLILLDSSGKDIYVDLLPKYWEKLNAVAVVFDITSQNSLTNSLAWLELAKSSTFQQDKFPGVLIGNKTDLEDQRTISSKTAHEFATQNNIQYFECSAKEGIGIAEPFYFLTHQCYSMSLNEKN